MLAVAKLPYLSSLDGSARTSMSLTSVIVCRYKYPYTLKLYKADLIKLKGE